MHSVPEEAAIAQYRATSERAVVTAATPMAADAGVAVLRDGGTVYDAVVAAALVETVMLPPKCGLAGDVVALVKRADAAEPEALLSIGTAPRALAETLATRPLSAVGGLSVGIPGAPAGYRALAERGRMSLARLAAPAIELARDGFAWTEIGAYLTERSVEVLRAQNPDGVVYLPGGQPAAAGTHTKAPGLAEVLERYVAHPEALFADRLGDAVYEAIRRRGGVIERDELDSARAVWSAPATGAAGARRLWATPGPTHGPSLLDAVVASARDCSAGELVACVEAAIAHRVRTYGDRSSGGGTSVVTAADRNGDAVVLVHSNSFQRYGSGIVVEPYGLVLSNRPGRGFAATPGHPNFPAAGRRPVTTLHAWAVGLEDGTLMMGATPGGENQMRWNSQTVTNVLDGVHDPAALVVAPRWGRFGDRLVVEEGFCAADLVSLRARGEFDRAGRHSLRSAQQVLRLPGDHGPLSAGADPRTGAAARGL
ncbi:gamma-glutamyltransferase [Amycolatopsis methanolica]|uniref:Gamma-glutamyltransferase n=1 Tax=Amycolatopsis methanolica 239 TaxID=1068978 RepID=A0A076MYB1_AMYME|nr:gamma-glutamyltransferase [Amycolatopsis methanolica]AIJ26134.1 gamma-glutamyltransferase [Amycolatopsis methanolica 239]